MKAQLETRILSSFLLFVDHNIQKFGQAYTNYSSILYPIKSDIANKFAYATPFKGLCYDTSIQGATIMNGVYVNGIYTQIGTNGLSMINHQKGMVYFDNSLGNATVSGEYAFKEFNVELADKTEWNLLFETKFVSNNYYSQTRTGLAPDTVISPIIFILTQSQENTPFGFNRIQNNQISARCIIIADTEAQCLGASSILKNAFESHMPILTGVPFDSQWNFRTTTQFNYDSNPRDPNYQPWISSTRVVNLYQKGDYKDIERRMCMVDLTLSTITANP
jgi:hypothetical protein